MINQTNNFNELTQILQNVESFNIYTNGMKENVKKSSPDFKCIQQNLNKLFMQARIMPAFGVSLHNETLNELKTNTWLEINFDSEQEINELNFSSLVFKLEPTFGTNLIRKYNNRYDGRCIYLDFMQEINLNAILETLNKKEL